MLKKKNIIKWLGINVKFVILVERIYYVDRGIFV